MEKITLQKIFDLAWDHFIVNEGKPSVNLKEDGKVSGCCYLSKDGNKCAIGLALPEGHPSQQYSDYFPYLLDYYPDLFSDDVLNAGPAQLRLFQLGLHDDLINLEDGTWLYPLEKRKERYIGMAKQFNLTVPDSVLA